MIHEERVTILLPHTTLAGIGVSKLAKAPSWWESYEIVRAVSCLRSDAPTSMILMFDHIDQKIPCLYL